MMLAAPVDLTGVLPKSILVHEHVLVDFAGAAIASRISPETLSWHQDCVQFMQQEKLLANVLISQDSDWWHVEEPDGGQFNGYDSIYNDFLPLIPQSTWRKLLWDNPRLAFGE